ncbi:Uncharacterized protein FWK35_00030223 [Aphis craccivora]|uniref:Uncharacterized protein n=1 Tax=Aphis craccivora TaxID=307492 RepID=A0A6G0VZU2_APHCR|nr:Uncharacterized protein FWK35_00030223 [Aphis craccivora]
MTSRALQRSGGSIFIFLLFFYFFYFCVIAIFFKHKPSYPTTIDSKRSDKCIDITMIITSRNNVPISNFGGGFQCKSEYPWCIIEVKS